MAKVCYICGKKPITGHSISHSHKATKRRWIPNLQKIKIKESGKTKRVWICSTCLRSGKADSLMGI